MNKNLTSIESNNNQIKKITFNDKEEVPIYPGDYVFNNTC